ncbi:MAG TPA: serine/threonine-protein kinase [Polyangiaceae bacterium]|nr:serine/threonine-protein kinase [Polyangiaceae bacterium]
MSVSVPPSSGSTSRLAFPGAIVAGRYRLEEVVGHGGMGSVWRATHTGLGEQVAVKLVSANFVRSSEALRRFDTEAKAAARLRSRHVPQVFDNGVLEDGTPFLVMELLHGESLAARIARAGPIPLPETISILEQCCRALTRAHSLGIVHRDIKPENVYLAQSVDDDGYIVKVLDFGIAKVTSSLAEDGRSSTRTGTLLGTPLYMSPEQARGLRTVDSRTDLYSLGLVAYTMLSGRLPFGGETLGELLLQICAEPLPSLRAVAPGLPPAIEAWFQKACARLPDDRFPSAQAFVEALRVAAGISSPGPSDPLAAKFPSISGVGAAPDAASRSARSPVPETLNTPSTTSGTALGPPFTPGARGRIVLIVAVAALGLVVVPVVVFVSHARRADSAAPAAAGAKEPAAVVDRGLADAGASVSLAPLTTEPAAQSSPPAIAASPPTGATTARPAVGAPAAAAPPAPHLTTPVAKPAAPPARAPAKPSGGIDLGY